MNILIRLNLGVFFQFRFLIGGMIYLLILASTRSLHLWNRSEAEALEVNYFDLLLEMTGVYHGLGIIEYISWIAVLAPIFFIVHGIFYPRPGLDALFITRSRSRGMWWLAKIIASGIMTGIYTSFLFLSHALVSIFVFPLQGNWSPYAVVYHPLSVGMDTSILGVMLYKIFIFLLGSVVLVVVLQWLSVVFYFHTPVYMGMIVLFSVISLLYLQDLLPREVALLVFPSSRDLASTEVTKAVGYVGLVGLFSCLFSVCKIRVINIGK